MRRHRAPEAFSPAERGGLAGVMLIAAAVVAALASISQVWVHGLIAAGGLAMPGLCCLAWACGHAAGRDYEHPYRDP